MNPLASFHALCAPAAGWFAAVALFGCNAAVAQPAPVPAEHWTWGNTAEGEQRAYVITDVYDAVLHSNFAALDALHSDYSGAHGTTTSGASRLDLFYATLNERMSQGMAPGNCEGGATDFMQRWELAAPRSPARIIAKAKFLEDRAWCFRGSNYADEVSAEAWQPYRDHIAAALSVLEKGRAAASGDPEFYARMIDLYIDQGRPKAALAKLLDEASERFPYYYGLYFSANRSNLPRWGGSLAAIDAGARYAAAKTSLRDGTSGYARVYWHMAICKCHADEFEAVDWPTMKVAMADLAIRYPVDWTYLHLIQLSCRRGDADEARKYFDQLTINQVNSWNENEWKTCRALVGRSAEGLQALR